MVAMEGGLATVGVIGAGATAREITVYALRGGYRVVLEDVSATRLAEARAHVSAMLKQAAERGGSSPESTRKAFANFSTTQSFDEVLRSADLLVEAAPEDAELQLEIFTIFDKFAKPPAILASTGSSVSVSDLAEMTTCPERCVGLQFPGPEAKCKFLRIVGALETDERTLRICGAFALRIGLEPKFVSESGDPIPAVQESRGL
jgi:3-hydroxybutyryl-CoA dehydrogenase